MKTKLTLLAALCGLATAAFAATPDDGSVLPFAPTPSASKAGPTLQESTHKRRVEPTRLPKDAPNVLIVLIDDVGFGTPDTFGGFAHTPTLSKLRDEGISYNRFHTTAICSPTRAALLTGRNMHRVGSGTIAESPTRFSDTGCSASASSSGRASGTRWRVGSSCRSCRWSSPPSPSTSMCTGISRLSRWSRCERGATCWPVADLRR